MQNAKRNTQNEIRKTKYALHIAYHVLPNLGFTLIEMLVVISVLGILLGLGASRYLAVEKQGRDARRKSDLGQYRIALENYANVNNSAYPILACANVSSLCGLNNFQTTYFSGECINDPRADEITYYYYCSDTQGLTYAIWAKLESGGYFEVCSNGKVGKLINQPDATDGNCSL